MGAAQSDLDLAAYPELRSLLQGLQCPPVTLCYCSGCPPCPARPPPPKPHPCKLCPCPAAPAGGATGNYGETARESVVGVDRRSLCRLPGSVAQLYELSTWLLAIYDVQHDTLATGASPLCRLRLAVQGWLFGWRQPPGHGRLRGKLVDTPREGMGVSVGAGALACSRRPHKRPVGLPAQLLLHADPIRPCSPPVPCLCTKTPWPASPALTRTACAVDCPPSGSHAL